MIDRYQNRHQEFVEKIQRLLYITIINNDVGRRMSAADLKDDDPWIPGQQLYGRMIPRPEDDEEIHKEEAIVGERLMKVFQERVNEIKESEGLSEYERKELLKLGVHANAFPMNFGFEVTPLLFENDGEDEEADDTSDDDDDTTIHPLLSKSLDETIFSRDHLAFL